MKAKKPRISSTSPPDVPWTAVKWAASAPTHCSKSRMRRQRINKWMSATWWTRRGYERLWRFFKTKWPVCATSQSAIDTMRIAAIGNSSMMTPTAILWLVVRRRTRWTWPSRAITVTLWMVWSRTSPWLRAQPFSLKAQASSWSMESLWSSTV